MTMLDSLKNWFWQKALSKAIKRMVQLFIAWAIAMNMQNFGVQPDEAKLTLTIMGALEFLRNWLKVKKGWNIL